MPAKKKTVTTAKSAKPAEPSATGEISGEDHHVMVSEAAYFRALERGFEGGSPEEDWYAAEADIRKVFREM